MSCDKDNTDPLYKGIPHIHGTRYKYNQFNNIKNTTDGNTKASAIKADDKHNCNANTTNHLTIEVEPSVIPKNYRCSTDDKNRRNK